MRSDCPVSYALDFFGDKWTFLIIRDLMFEGKRFYREFLSSKEAIASNILSDRLKKLENAGMITSQVYEPLKTRKEYKLTRKGKDLLPVLIEMMVWSATHQQDLALPEDFVTKAKTDRASMIKVIESKMG